MKTNLGKIAISGIIATMAMGCGATSDDAQMLGSKFGLSSGHGRHHEGRESESEHRSEHGSEDGSEDGTAHRERYRGGGSGSEDDSESGRPSQRQRIKNPGNQSSVAGSVVELSLEKARPGDDDQYEFTAANLPAGLVLNAATGVISGTVTAAPGSYVVSVTARENEPEEDHLAAKFEFTWVVTAQ